MNVLALFRPIKLIVLDVDGVLTDGSLILLDNGEMARRMNIKDGYALQLAVKKSYNVVIISGGNSPAVKLRLEKLGIKNVHAGVTNKTVLLTEIIDRRGFQKEQILYMGDDIPDILPMKLAGLSCAPADAVPEVREAADYISPLHGGNGCVRDVIEKILRLNNDWNEHPEVASL